MLWIRIFLFTVFSAKGNTDGTDMRFLMRLRKRKHKVCVRHMPCWFSARFIELHMTFICISYVTWTRVRVSVSDSGAGVRFVRIFGDMANNTWNPTRVRGIRLGKKLRHGCPGNTVKTHQGQTSSRHHLYLYDGSCIRYTKKSSTNWFVLHSQVSNVQSNKKLQCHIAAMLVLFPRTYFDGYQTYLIVLVSSYTLYTKYDNSSNFCVILGYFWCIFDYCSS